MKIKMIFPLIILGLLGGCNFFHNPSIKLFTDNADILAYTEVYNSSQDDYRIEIHYTDAYINGESKADLVLNEGLASTEQIGNYEILDDIMNRDNVDAGEFYANLLVKGKIDNSQTVLPFNFNMPVVVFKQGRIKNPLSNFIISLEELKHNATEFNQQKNNKFIALGFSPFWNMDFLFNTAELFNSNISMESESLSWDDTALTNSVNYIINWIEDSCGGFIMENNFSSRYLIEPMYKLVNNDRIGFYIVDLTDFLQIPREKRENLDFRFLSYNNKISVIKKILYFGIPRGAANIQGAKAFLKWIFKPQNQEKLIQSNSIDNANAFGLADGFSSLYNINEVTIPQHHSILIGHMPTAEFFIFSPSLPKDWQEQVTLIILNKFKELLESESDSNIVDQRIKG
jgi:hypothetical protein